MLATTPRNDRRSALGAIARWWKRWIRSRSETFELESSGSDQVERMARDLGMSAAELRFLVGQGSDQADLLHRRLELLRLDPGALSGRDPLLFRSAWALEQPSQTTRRGIGGLG